jgi:hypothetical protein
MLDGDNLELTVRLLPQLKLKEPHVLRMPFYTEEQLSMALRRHIFFWIVEDKNSLNVIFADAGNRMHTRAHATE